MVGVGCGMEAADATEVVEESSELSDSMVSIFGAGAADFDCVVCWGLSTTNRVWGAVGWLGSVMGWASSLLFASSAWFGVTPWLPTSWSPSRSESELGSGGSTS